MLFPGNTVEKPNWEQLRQSECLGQPRGIPTQKGWGDPSWAWPPRTHSAHGLQRPSRPPEKVPDTQSAQSKVKLKLPGVEGMKTGPG